MKRLVSFFLVFCFFFVTIFAGTTPTPDTSEVCTTCKAQVEELDIVWTNATSVQQILDDLDTSCKKKYKDPKERVICQEVASVLVQIPPSLFKGMEDLHWPISEALCATFFKCHLNCCGSDDPPEQVHLSLSSTDKSIMGVSWVSLNQKASVVQYGQNPEKLDLFVSGSFTLYNDTKLNYLKSVSGWIGTIHRATMKGLAAGTTYYYRVGDGENKWSEVFSFTTMKVDDIITYAVLGDMDFEQNNTLANVISLVEAGKVQCVLFAGDESYADGYEPHWDVFMRRIEAFAAKVPLMLVAGNHEFWYNFTSYKNRFFLPGVMDEGGSGDGMYYSFDAGYAHFIAANSETAIDTAYFDPKMMNWMTEEFQKVDRSKTPFVIALFHRPLYASNQNSCTQEQGFETLLRSQGEQLFFDSKLDVCITGHVHAYERSFPTFNCSAVQKDYINPKAPVYILQGASGNREGNSIHQLEDWSAAGFKEIGYGLMTVSKNSLKWEYFAADAINGPTLLDSFVLTK